MKFLQRILAVALAAMLLMPALCFAEDYGFSAGDLTFVSLEESLAAGEQINVTIRPSLQFGEQVWQECAGTSDEKKLKALIDLMDKAELCFSAYDDFGNLCLNVGVNLDGVDVFKLNALLGEDGSLQAMSNLTGKYVFTLPAGSVDPEGVSVSLVDEEMEDIEIGSEEFRALSAEDRLRLSLADVGSMLVSQILGWTSYTQIDTDDGLYVFDNTPFDATETRDAVAQRMVGTIAAADFNALLWNNLATLRDQHADFQQALADVLAEYGVTRCQMRQLADFLFAQETIDPAADFVTPSHKIPDDGALCAKEDVYYLLVKATKCVDNMWENSTENDLHMIVAYDDMGGMVGLELDLPLFTDVLPYEGSMIYDIRTDDNEQRFHTSHGELQILDGNRIIGDLDMQLGKSVGGVKESSMGGRIGIANAERGSYDGLNVNAYLRYEITDGGEGETIDLFFSTGAEQGDEANEDFVISCDGKTSVANDGFAFDGAFEVNMSDIATFRADVGVEAVEYEGNAFIGGQAVDLTTMDDEMGKTIASEVTGNAAKIGAGLMFHPGILSSVMTLIGK